MKIDLPKRQTTPQSCPETARTVAHHTCAEILADELPLVARREKPAIQSSEGYIYAKRDLLCIEHLARLPVTRCIKTNKTADKVVKLNLRSPMNPESWWGKCPRRLTVGLTAREYTRYCFQNWVATLGMFFSLAAMGLGIALNLWIFGIGFVIFLMSSLLNVVSPVWYRSASKEFTTVKGVSRQYLSQFDQVNEGDNNPCAMAAQSVGAEESVSS